MCIDKKIYVIGPAGSGKTYFAQLLAREYGLLYFSLDDIKWVNDGPNKEFTTSRPYSERREKISDIIRSNDKWVFDGVYCADWVEQIFQEANEIIILNTPLWLCQWRCVKRFIKTYDHRKTSWKSVIKLLIWNRDYLSRDLPMAMARIAQLNKKCVVLYNNELKQWISGIQK